MERRKGVCLNCFAICGALYNIQDGKLVRVEPDKEHPVSRGTLCPKAFAIPEIVYHPERMRYPLKRLGKRGEGRWERIDWNEAFSIVSSKLVEVREEYGAESILGGQGGYTLSQGLQQALGMFWHLLGTPNVLSPTHVCTVPAAYANIYTCGFPATVGLMGNPDLENSRCVVLWGTSPQVSLRSTYPQLKNAMDKGAKLIVIDPRLTAEASKADIWLQVRPGTDCALALGFLNIIIGNELYEKEFVERWTYGFKELKDHVKSFTLEKVSEITWIPKEKILEAAHMYSKIKPSSIAVGGGSMSQTINAFQTNRAISILAAITGNLDVPGGQLHINSPLGGRSSHAANSDGAFKRLSAEQIKKRLGYERFPILAERGLLFSPPVSILPAIIEGKPYPLKAFLSFGGNPILALENSRKVREALMKLDFIAVVDLFMSPTAEISDLVLPAAHFVEKDIIADYLGRWVFCQPKMVEPSDMCLDEKLILIELAKRLNLGGFWNSVDQYLNYILEPARINFEQFKEKGMIERPLEYKKYEKFNGFLTQSGKVDIYSEALQRLGYQPLPFYEEPPESPLSSPKLAQEYPLILIAGFKTIPYTLSNFRNIKSLRNMEEDPLIEIHPEKAESLGIRDGDWVKVESPRGRIKARAKLLSGLNPNVVAMTYGWWYGYEEGWKEVNINILTDNEHFDPHTGSPPLRGLLCKVYK